MEEPVLFLTRYEYANLYHSMGDFYNAYQTQNMYGHVGHGKVHVVFLDGHSAGALDDMWPTLFGKHVSYISQIVEKYANHKLASNPKAKVCFRRALFVPPAYRCALSVDMMSGVSDACTNNPALKDFAAFMSQQYKLDSIQPMDLFTPPGQTAKADIFGQPLFPSLAPQTHSREEIEADKIRPIVTVICRRDYLAHPRLQSLRATRKFANEVELSNSLVNLNERFKSDKNHPVLLPRFLFVDFAQLSVLEQLVLIRQSILLVGIHGAGLSYALFLREKASLFELVPPEYAVRPHFRYFARWAGRRYETMSISAETGNGHSVDAQTFSSHVNTLIQGLLPPAPKIIVNAAASARPQEPLSLKGVSSQDKVYISQSSHTKVFDPAQILDHFASASVFSRHEELSSRSEYEAAYGRSVDGHRLCVIVPFRDSLSPTSQGANRTANLNTFIPHMLRHFNKVGREFIRDYEIIIVEQTQGKVFNKGALFNIGYKLAKPVCDYVVLHDVDQLPDSPLNKYSYPNAPTHLCTATSQFNYQMAYGTMVGGAMLMTNDQYEQVNGYSNFYWGWGQEDDDFYYRIARRFNNVDRLPPDAGRFQALSHPRVKDLDVTPIFTQGTQHLTDTRTGRFDFMTDGLSNLKYRPVMTTYNIKPGVKKVLVELQFDYMPEELHQRK